MICALGQWDLVKILAEKWKEDPSFSGFLVSDEESEKPLNYGMNFGFSVHRALKVLQTFIKSFRNFKHIYIWMYLNCLLQTIYTNSEYVCCELHIFVTAYFLLSKNCSNASLRFMTCARRLIYVLIAQQNTANSLPTTSNFVHQIASLVFSTLKRFFRSFRKTLTTFTLLLFWPLDCIEYIECVWFRIHVLYI